MKIAWHYKVLYITMLRVQLRIYFKWAIWTKRYNFYRLTFPTYKDGFILMCWPLEIGYSKNGWRDLFSDNAVIGSSSL